MNFFKKLRKGKSSANDAPSPKTSPKNSPWAVSEQTRETGVRLALGATTNRVMAMVLGRAASFVSTGIILGLAGAFAASKSIESLLYGVPARDPLTFALAPATSLLVAAIAARIPARKPAMTDPVASTRCSMKSQPWASHK